MQCGIKANTSGMQCDIKETVKSSFSTEFEPTWPKITGYVMAKSSGSPSCSRLFSSVLCGLLPD